MPKKRALRKAQLWSAGIATEIPQKPTAYETRLLELGLQDATFEKLVDSVELRSWCERHRNMRFIPELLLRKLGLRADQFEGGRADRSNKDARAFARCAFESYHEFQEA